MAPTSRGLQGHRTSEPGIQVGGDSLARPQLWHWAAKESSYTALMRSEESGIKEHMVSQSVYYPSDSVEEGDSRSHSQLGFKCFSKLVLLGPSLGRWALLPYLPLQPRPSLSGRPLRPWG